MASGESNGKVGQIVQKLRGFIRELLSDVRGPGLKSKFRELFRAFTNMYDQFAKRLYLRARESIQGFTDRVGVWFTTKWRAVYNNYKPHILRTFDEVETSAWIFAERLIGWLEQLGIQVKSSAPYLRMQELATYLESIYKDFSEKSKRENLEKYYTIVVEKLKSGVRIALDRVAPFVQDWGGELVKAWQTLMEFHVAQRVRAAVVAAVNKFIWMVRYVDIRGHVMDMTVFLLEHGWTIFSQTGVDASQKYIKEKTYFKFTPEIGEVELIQKLPLDWHAFSHRPGWQSLPEYKQVTWIRDFFVSPTNTSFLMKFWHKMIKLHFNPSHLIPPFPATGYMIGEQHFMTFDGRALDFKGRCQHLLVADMIGGMWAVAVNYHSHSSKTIVIYVHDAIIELSRDFRVMVNGRSTELPVQVASAHIHRGLHKLHVDTHHSFHVTWNLAQDVLSITLHGSYFGKTGGLLGLYNYEPNDDLSLPNGSTTDVVSVLAQGWMVSPRGCDSTDNIATPPALEPVSACSRIFQSKGSPLKRCFFEVESQPYLDMCSVDYHHEPQDTCTSATAYMEACSANSIPIKIPEYCVQCEYQTNDGQTHTLAEGALVVLETEELLKSTDVVILVEARECNNFLAENKPFNRFSHFINIMNEELEGAGIHSVRYAMVAYGGEEPYARPVVATVNNQIFTDAAHIHQALDHVTFAESDDGDESAYYSYDAFLAFAFAARLNYRAGVTITYVHFPCESCKPIIPSMDFSTMYHILLEYSVTLHVFNPEPFQLAKASEQKKLLGIDSDKAYTVKDARRPLTGDPVLRRQIPTPKDNLMYCAPLALETNGTIFTSVHLSGEQRSTNRIRKNVKRLAAVFGKRVALTALPSERKRCICTPNTPDGSASVECDNWGREHLSILEEYGYDTDFNFAHETNSQEEGSCARRDEHDVCVEWTDG